MISKSRLASLASASALIATVAVAIGPAAALAAPPPAYLNGFEDSKGKYYTETKEMFDVTRVGPTADAASGNFYAEAGERNFGDTELGAFSRLGGYSSTFPTRGYSTSVDVYLDTSKNDAVGTDLRFDWSSAINNTSATPTHRRDFVFHVGTNPAVPGQFLVSASNNAPGDPAGGTPATISQSGWYTFKHEFKDAGGVLSVDMKVIDAHGTLLSTWTLSDSSDIIGQTVGGNRYAWLVTNDFDDLRIDNITRVKN